jgi:hypothetical protein
MKYFILGILLSSFAQAYTLNNNFGASFKDSDVKVFVDAGTTCATNQITVSELEGMIGPAVDKFWNEVPTSSLKLDAAGYSEAIFTMNHGRLCSPTDDTCISAGNADPDPTKRLIPAVTDIVIACNDHSSNFGGSGVLAVTVPNKFSGKKIAGAVILINDGSNAFGNLSRSDQIAVIAHEIGHAIGLGHSEEKAALMYYRTVNLRSNLGQDDIDGVSYLYPVVIDAFGLVEGGLLGGCGTITFGGKNPPKDPPFVQMVITLGFLVLCFELLRRPKARSAFRAFRFILFKNKFFFRVK